MNQTHEILVLKQRVESLEAALMHLVDEIRRMKQKK